VPLTSHRDLRHEPPSGPVVIIGDPNSLFPRHLASYWRSLGMDVVIVTHSWEGERSLSDGTEILSSAERETRPMRGGLKLLRVILRWVEKAVLTLGKARYRKAMGLGGKKDYHPSFVDPLVNGISIARFVRSLHPRFVFGQEVFAYGFATALCHGFPQIIMPWGGDIYRYAETSFIAFAMVKYALRQADLICPSSVVAAWHIRERYRVPEAKIHAVSWGVDRNMFRRANEDQRRRVCERFGIDPRAMIFMNVRRFQPAWGCDTALEAFIQFAQENPSSHFVMLGGAGSASLVHDAHKQLIERGLEYRFTLFEDDIPLADCAELMSVSDVFVSLARTRDMRSASVLQAASAGGGAILGEQAEYREMERLGFRALFVNPKDADSVLNALRSYASDAELWKKTVAQNREYLAEYEDHHQQMARLLNLIDEVCQSYSRSRA
jgi:glycosyltransferase involved in cell wall biosynthesis